MAYSAPQLQQSGGGRARQWLIHSWQSLILFTVLVPVGVKLLPGADIGYLDATLLGVCILIVRLVVKLDDQIAVLGRRAKEWEGDHHEQVLIRFRDILRALRSKGNLVAVDILLRDAELLERRFKSAVDPGDLQFSRPDLEAREQILGHLGIGETIRFVHFFRDNAKYFGKDEEWERFYEAVEEATRTKDVRVRRLYVARDEVRPLDEVSHRLLTDHAAIPKYECAIVSEEQFKQNRVASPRLPSAFHDFGIYGQEYVFYWSEDGKRGTLSHDDSTIKVFTQFFEACWKRASRDLAWPPPPRRSNASRTA